MFPLVVSTIPENGSENVGLDDIIKVTFNGELDEETVTAENVILENYTTGDRLDIIPELADSNTSIVVTPPQTATGGHRYEGLNQYRLLITNIKSISGEILPGTFELRFTTEPGSVEEVPNDDEEDEYQETDPVFEVVRTYPKANSLVAPEVIKIQCNNPISQETDITGIMILDDMFIEDIDDALFMGQNLIQDETSININNNIIEITPPELTGGTKYIVVISKVTDINGVEIIPYMFSFHANFSPMYVTVEEIQSLHIVKTLTKNRERIEIAKYIHQNSKLAEFIAQLAENTSIDWENPPMYVGEYVKYKTQYDIVFDVVTELSSTSTMKQLKDFLVDYRFSLSDLMDLLKQLELQYKYWEDLLKGHKNRGSAKPLPFIKGENVDEIPDFMDRKFRDIEGNKEW